MVTDMEGYNKIIIGIGMNVFNVFPENLKTIAVSLLEAGYEINMLEFFIEIILRIRIITWTVCDRNREEALATLREKSIYKGKKFVS